MVMKLFEYLRRAGLSDTEFGERIGAKRQSVWRYKTGYWPRQDVMERIVIATDGAVTPNDWMSAPVRKLIKKAEET
jgi:hypothetical protein